MSCPKHQHGASGTPFDRDLLLDCLFCLREERDAALLQISDMESEARKWVSRWEDVDLQRKDALRLNGELFKILGRVKALDNPNICDCWLPSDGPHAEDCVNTQVAKAVQTPPLKQNEETTRECPHCHIKVPMYGGLWLEHLERHTEKRKDVCDTCKAEIPAGDCRYNVGKIQFCGRCGVPQSR